MTLQQIEKEKAVEVQKKAIADVIRERIVVERTVAEQEEEIKNVRTMSDAERTRKSTVVLAEGQAQEQYIAQTKSAEADEQRARHKAGGEQILAEAKLAVASKMADAKKREAEGIEAVSAAGGLAEARVAMAKADAHEKEGLVAAKIKLADAERQEARRTASLPPRSSWPMPTPWSNSATPMRTPCNRRWRPKRLVAKSKVSPRRRSSWPMPTPWPSKASPTPTHSV